MKDNISIDESVSSMVESIKKKCEGQSIKHSEVLSLYKDYIKLVCELVKSFNLPNDPLFYSILLNNLIIEGHLSYDDKFEPDFTTHDELECSRGLKVVLGSGCCRNVSKFHKDIFDSMGLYSKEFFCYESGTRFFTKKKDANHVINLIESKNGLCGFDVFNDVLYNFINETQLRAMKIYFDNFLTYKPDLDFLYGESKEDIMSNILRFKNSTSSWILYDEYIDMRAIVYSALDEYKHVIDEFKSNTSSIKNKIRHLI